MGLPSQHKNIAMIGAKFPDGPSQPGQEHGNDQREIPWWAFPVKTKTWQWSVRTDGPSQYRQRGGTPYPTPWTWPFPGDGMKGLPKRILENTHLDFSQSGTFLKNFSRTSRNKSGVGDGTKILSLWSKCPKTKILLSHFWKWCYFKGWINFFPITIL